MKNHIKNKNYVKLDVTKNISHFKFGNKIVAYVSIQSERFVGKNTFFYSGMHRFLSTTDEKNRKNTNLLALCAL